MSKSASKSKTKPKRKSPRATKRPSKASTKALPAARDPALPTTIAEIEAAQDVAMQEMQDDPPARVDRDEDGRTVHMGPAAARFMKLQVQLFRVVFGREPRDRDPLFWDREREHEGVFPIDPADHERAIRNAARAIGMRPEVGYAMALTGLTITERNASAHSVEDFAAWEDAVDDYRRQAETGVVPLTPNEFLDAWTAMNEVASKTRPAALNSAWGMGQVLTAVRDAVGSDEKGGAAMTRLTALVALGASGEIGELVSATGFLGPAVIAAASAEVDRRTGSSSRAFASGSRI